MRCTLRILIGAALLLVLVSGCGSRDGTRRPGQIILISMDTVRADAVSGVGSADATPEIAAIARQGVTFRRFFAASNYTLPSHMTLFTGLDPEEHGVYRGVVSLAPEVRTLAEVLRQAGYRTQAFHEGGYVAPRFGFERGFDEYLEFDPLEMIRDQTQRVMEWVRAAAGEPYFLFLHTYHAHTPYGGYAQYRDGSPERGLLSEPRIAELRALNIEAPDRAALPRGLRAECTLYNLLAESWRDSLGCGDESYSAYTDSPHLAADRAAMLAGYQHRIREIDAFVGTLRETLESLGEWDDTLLILTADHGEAFFEYGGHLHAYLPWEEVLWVPLVISYPELLRTVAGREVQGLAGHADLMRSLLVLAGVEAPTQGSGIDLSPVILAEAELPKDRELFPAILRAPHLPQQPLRRVALREPLQYVEGHPEFGDDEGLLLDLAARDGLNRRAERPEDVAALRAAIARHRAGLEPAMPLDFRTGERWVESDAPPGEELSDDQRERLRGLGYLR